MLEVYCFWHISGAAGQKQYLLENDGLVNGLDENKWVHMSILAFPQLHIHPILFFFSLLRSNISLMMDIFSERVQLCGIYFQ